MKKLFFALFPLILTACAGNPVSYLPSGNTPIVNVEANVAEQIAVEAKSDALAVENRTDTDLNVVYKLFWYDLDGVTQPSNESWQNLWLEPKQRRQITLAPPTAESANYRIYLRGVR